MTLTKTFSLLQQEALLAQACFCNGLTALRRANLGSEKGLYYSAFFELSIAFERMMKLTFIIDRMASDDLTPSCFKEVKAFRHDLVKLFARIKLVCAARNSNALKSFTECSIPFRLLTFLSGFAVTDRYANINSLTAHAPKTIPDPLATWGVLAKAIVEARASKAERRLVAAAYESGAAVAPCFMSLISDLDQAHLGVDRVLAASAELDVAAKHAVFELITLIAALRSVLVAVTDAAVTVNVSRSRALAGVPDVSEIFDFAWPNRKFVMRKRRWP
jgi:hypothetical protein